MVRAYFTRAALQSVLQKHRRIAAWPTADSPGDTRVTLFWDRANKPFNDCVYKYGRAVTPPISRGTCNLRDLSATLLPNVSVGRVPSTGDGGGLQFSGPSESKRYNEWNWGKDVGTVDNRGVMCTHFARKILQTVLSSEGVACELCWNRSMNNLRWWR